MEKHEVELLLENGVGLEFVIYPAHLKRGYNLGIRRPGQMEHTHLKTARGEVRLFRTLEAVWSLVAIDWNRSFHVSHK